MYPWDIQHVKNHHDSSQEPPASILFDSMMTLWRYIGDGALPRQVEIWITCKKYKVQYIGESELSIKERFSEHLGYVYNEHLDQATEEHFNSKGHLVADMEVTILEKIFSRDPQVRKERESLFIKKFNSKHKGLNKKS